MQASQDGLTGTLAGLSAEAQGSCRAPAGLADRGKPDRPNRRFRRARPAPGGTRRQLLAVPPVRDQRHPQSHRLAALGTSSRLFVRQREWEAAHTVWLWVDMTASMDFRSHLRARDKARKGPGACVCHRRALGARRRAGGAIGLMPPMARRDTTEKMAEALIADANSGAGTAHVLQGASLSRAADCVLFGDFLDPRRDRSRPPCGSWRARACAGT